MITYCPEHEDNRLRIEHHDDEVTGYCSTCPKHYPICCDQSGEDVRMEMCTKIKGHNGKHQYNVEDKHRIMEW